jgi:predicted acetyltransferase
MIYLKHKETSGRLPTSEYKLFDDGKLVGKIQVRHKPSHGVGIPENMASHIYYEILPEYRSKGYGKQVLALGLVEARKIGLNEVSVTCMEDNIGSKKIIEANRGVYIEDSMIPEEGKKMLKYRIVLSDPDSAN